MIRNAMSRRLGTLVWSRRVVGIRRRLVHARPCRYCSQTIPLATNDHPVRKYSLRRAFSSSSSSSSQDEQALNRLTYEFLNAPLGTMSASAIDDATVVAHNWLREGSGYGVDMADRLLQRLVYERASGAFAARQCTVEIVDLHQHVFHSWLTLAEFRMALPKAEIILERIMEWKDRGLILDSLHAPFPEFVVAFVQACLTTRHLDFAAKHLLQWTETPDATSASQLAPLFHSTLHICLFENHRSIAGLLVDRMELLTSEYNWEGLDIHDDTRMLLFGGESVSPSEAISIQEVKEEDNDSKQYSPEELNHIYDRFLTFLKIASEKHRQQVLDIEKQKRKLPRSDQSIPLQRAILEYYVRIKDVRKASQLIHLIVVDEDYTYVKTGQLDKNDAEQYDNDKTTLQNVCTDVLRLWAQSSDGDAPWRAQEVLQRMEELEDFGLLAVTTSSYNLLCETWKNSKEKSMAREKVEAILSRMEDAKDSGDTSKAPDSETRKLVLTVRDNDKQTQMIDKVKGLDQESIAKTVTSTLESLASHVDTDDAPLLDEVRAASKLLHQALSLGVTATPSMCMNLLKSYQRCRRAVDAVHEIQVLERTLGANLTLACYKVVMKTLLDSPGLPMERKTKFIEKAFQRFAAGKLAANSHEIETLMEEIMKELEFHGRPLHTESMLNLFEQVSLSDKAPMPNVCVPVECFNSALKCWSDSKNIARTEALFNRLMTYYEAGHTSLLPNTTSMNHVLSCLRRAGSPSERAANSNAFLQKMIELHKKSGSDMCKPDTESFKEVLIALWKPEQGKHAAVEALGLLNQMLSLDIQPTEVFTFNIVMEIVNNARYKTTYLDQFAIVSSLLGRMERLGLEPNNHTHVQILRACCTIRNDGKRTDALQLVIDSVASLRRLETSSVHTYGLAAKAVGNIFWKKSDADKRDKVATDICRLCVRDGYMDIENERFFRSIMKEKSWKRVSGSFNNSTTSEPTTNRTILQRQEH